MTAYKVYIVEDDKGISNSIKELLNTWGYVAQIVRDYRNVALECFEYEPHIVLMDIGLPFYDGYYWCSEIRKKSKVPIIFISSATDNMNIVMAMNMGADDFIPKPFDFNVLMAKINSLLRRTYDFGLVTPVLEHDGAILNIGEYTLSYKDSKIDLTKNEYRILLTLMENKGKVVSREKLMDVLWQTDSFVDENTLTVNVGRLRKKLISYGLNEYITTKVGVGYMVG